MGMTATPWRGDGQKLSSIFGDAIDTVSLVDGMAMGYLAQVDYRIFCDNVDWDNIENLTKQNLSIRDLNKRLFLPQRDEAVIARIQQAANSMEKPRIAIFSPSIEHSNRFAAMLTAAGLPCAALSRVDKAERRKRLLAFEAGSYTAVAAVDVMNEGIDIPDVNLLVFLRATHSRRIFVQQLGRGLRLAEGKEKVIVLDFVSDIRRMAEMIEMNNEGKTKGKKNEVVYLENGFVSFSNPRIEKFVNVWLEDVADLSDSDDQTTLTFPEGF
jgi:superfamily II DNA or RNA helicase